MRQTKKIFVLDTSVILYDHEAILNFGKHDVAIPITVLEELDNFKKGNDTKNYAAREFIRFIDRISKEQLLKEWVQLQPGKGRVKVIHNGKSSVDANEVFGEVKADHKILNAALALQECEPESQIVLVTKDISLRLKAKSVSLFAEDYETGKVKDVSELSTGKFLVEHLPSELIDEMYAAGFTHAGCVPQELHKENYYFVLKNGKKSALAVFRDEQLKRVEKRPLFRIDPRNAEQAFAIHALSDTSIPLVALQGVPGSGKTLLAIAAALEQRRDFKQILVARPVVPLSNKDLGFLPGDIKSKLNPYMEPIWDNIKFIKSLIGEREKESQRIDEMVQLEKIQIAPLAYIRGRSLSNVFMIIDEAQNLTPHEVKTIITRAGENTKLVFTGDIHQIDTPYLDSQSNGLSYLIDRLKEHPLFAHITLDRGERSELANLASDML